MPRATALLLLITLTGTPVASVVCIALCGQAAIAASESACHREQEAAAEGSRLSEPDCCDMTLLDTPSVVKPAQRWLHAPVRHASTLPALSNPLGLGRGGLRQITPRPANSPPLARALYVALRI